MRYGSSACAGWPKAVLALSEERAERARLVRQHHGLEVDGPAGAKEFLAGLFGL